MKFPTIFVLLTIFLSTNSFLLQQHRTAFLKQWLIESASSIKSVPNITRPPFNTFDPLKYHVILCHPDIKRNIDWKRKKNHEICGGTLVRRNKVLTAANCVFTSRHKRLEKYDFMVVHGSKDVYGTGGKFYYPLHIEVSSKYNPRETAIQFDIAVIILDRDVDGILDSDCPRLASETPPERTVAMFSGYGRFYKVGFTICFDTVN